MGLREQIISQAAAAFDQVTPGLEPGARFFLLKPADGHTSALQSVRELTNGVFVRWNRYREQMEFMIASADETLEDDVAQSSAIGYGVPTGINEIDVFAISHDQHDRLKPTGTSPFWKLFGSREAKRRFTVS